jgi:hypothetical protein
MWNYGRFEDGIVREFVLMNSSGTNYVIDNAQSIPSVDLSTVICDYCGSTYLAELIRSKQIMNCLGCGSARFHFGR